MCFQAAAWAEGFSPEAWDLIAALERRIEAGRAEAASLDVLLAALAPGEGCEDWEEEAAWKADPDVRAALAEVCPDLPRSARSPSRQALRMDLAAEESVRPSVGGLPGPSLSGALRGSRGGLRLAATAGSLRRRQAWLEGPAWKAQAGQLDFEDLPHLAFVTGRRSFPGGGWAAGPEGVLAASSASLDGLAGSVATGRIRAAAFGAWNRRAPGPDPEDPADLRRDALAYSLAAGWEAGPWRGTWQAAHLRLEVPDREPGEVTVGGLEIRREEPGLRLGIAGSGLRPGAPARGEGPGSPARGGTAPGAYAEAAWEEGKPGGYRLEAWQASPGWASPLAARPALSRDTADPGLPLPGRGEGGARLRSEVGLLEAEGVALRLQAAARAGWALGEAPAAGGFLAGEGRASLQLVAGVWTSETTWGSGWRREDLPAAGHRLTLGQRVAREGKRWRTGGIWSRRETADGRATWPVALEIGRSVRGGIRWQARLTARDARFPARDWGFALDQAWPLGSGLRLSHALRLPVASGELREDFGYRVKLEFAGR